MLIITGMFIFLGICSIMDILYQKIWMPMVGVMAVYVLICLSLAGEDLWKNIICGGIVAGFFCGMSVLTGKQIGAADGLLLGIGVLATGILKGLLFLFLCFSYAFVMALIAVLFFRKGRQSRLPFVPSIFGGYLTMILMML